MSAGEHDGVVDGAREQRGHSTPGVLDVVDSGRGTRVVRRDSTGDICPQCRYGRLYRVVRATGRVRLLIHPGEDRISEDEIHDRTRRCGKCGWRDEL